MKKKQRLFVFIDLSRKEIRKGTFEEIKKFVEQTYSNNPDFFEDAYNYTLLEITSKKDWTFNIKLTPKITELY